MGNRFIVLALHSLIFFILLSIMPLSVCAMEDANEIEICHNRLTIKHDFVNFDDMQDKEEFTKKLFLIRQEVFSGGTYDSFKSQFYNPKAASVDVHIMKNQEEKWVGYSLVRRFMVNYPEHESKNQNVFAVFRGQTGILPSYRGQYYMNVNMSAVGMEIIIDKFHQMNPHTNIVVFASLLRPESMFLMSKFKTGQLFFPSPFREPSLEIKGFMMYLRDFMGYFPDERSCYTIKNPTTSVLSDQERRKFILSENHYTKYFIELTGLVSGVAVMGLSIVYLVQDNPLLIDSTKEYAYLDSKL